MKYLVTLMVQLDLVQVLINTDEDLAELIKLVSKSDLFDLKTVDHFTNAVSFEEMKKYLTEEITQEKSILD